MADLPKPDSTYSNIHVTLVRRFMPARLRDVYPALNQPGQDSVPGADSAQ
jgi:hypothetical protein